MGRRSRYWISYTASVAVMLAGFALGHYLNCWNWPFAIATGLATVGTFLGVGYLLFRLYGN